MITQYGKRAVGSHTWGLAEGDRSVRTRMERVHRAIRQYRYLDPFLKPPFRRWDKLLEVEWHTRERSALSGHLSTLYWECMRSRPALVVEVGVREGESTEVFCQAARNYGGVVLSVDIESTQFWCTYPRWFFYQASSQELARRFASVCAELELGTVDLLFLDSSHIYSETVEELEVWLPHLSPNGMLVCHDTAMGRRFRACDGSLRSGWDNERGVTRALEAVLGVSINEDKNFVGCQGRWAINHTPLSSGLTMLTRI